LLRAYTLLGAAYLSRREPAQAVEAYRRFASAAPKDPRGPYLVGTALRAQGKMTEARREFEAALALKPDFVESLAHLVSLDISEKNPKAAHERVQRQIAQAPGTAAFHMLQGEIYLNTGDFPRAESAYLKTIELDPRLTESYLRIGNILAATGKYDQALARLQEAVKVNPRSVGAHMLLGVIQERRNEIPQAMKAYERALELAPRFAPAANNLAWLHTEHGGDKEKALELATLAKQLLPDDPRITDTLGWVLYKRGINDSALAMLTDSVGKLPNDPMIQYHLGMAQLKAGDKESARRNLLAAASAKTDFSGKADAQRALANLK
jgi:tetratricopeptide (TPR) repeat protein